jgi:hypothetical protein
MVIWSSSRENLHTSVDKAVVGFGCELADWAKCSSVCKDALMTSVFDVNYPLISSRDRITL